MFILIDYFSYFNSFKYILYIFLFNKLVNRLFLYKYCCKPKFAFLQGNHCLHHLLKPFHMILGRGTFFIDGLTLSMSSMVCLILIY